MATIHDEYMNIKWVLDESGTLTISGKGDMPDWEFDSCIEPHITLNPWYRSGCRNDIKKVIIEPGITSIGTGAFDRCIELEEVVLPDTVTVIKACAFYHCYSLTSINIQNILRIERDAFYCCHELKQISLPDTLEYIGSFAFSITGLEHLSIPKKITSLENNVFPHCFNLKTVNIHKDVNKFDDEFSDCDNLACINVSPENKHFSSVDGVLFDKELKTLLYYPRNKADEVYKVPDTVVTIITNSFLNCKNLKELYIPKGVTSDFSPLESALLEKVIVSEENPYYSSMDGVIFNKDKTELIYYPCNKKGSYEIPKTVTKIHNFAFDKCNSLTSLYIHENVEDLGEIHPYSNLESFEVSENNQFFASKDGVLFNKDYTELLRYPSNNPNENYCIPNFVLRVGEYAFKDCKNLKTMSIPSNVEEIWRNFLRFEECEKLEHIEVSEDNPNYASIDGVLFDKAKKSLLFYPQNKQEESYIVPDSVTDIQFFSFVNNNNLKKISLNNVRHINKFAFEQCKKLEQFDNYENNFMLYDGTLWDLDNVLVIWDKEYNCYHRWPVWLAIQYKNWNKSDDNPYLTYTNKVWNNIRYTLSDDGVLTFSSEIIPDGFTEFLWHTDRNIKEKIKKLIIETGTKLIGNNAFEDCVNLTEIYMPDNISDIGNCAFRNCRSLKSVHITKSDKNVDYCCVKDEAFKNCTSLEALDLSKLKTKELVIRFRAFANCSSMKEIIFPTDCVGKISQSAFLDCESLTEPNIPEGFNKP
jgi:surface protein